MATRKKAEPAQKKPGKSLAAYDAELAALAKETATVESNVGGSQYIKTRGGQLEYQGGVIPGNKMNVVILDHVIEYAYYADKYDADNPGSPDAFALGRDEKTLTWHENSLPEYAGELCADSDINQWGTADTGRGKAAKNIRRLALIPEDGLKDIPGAEVALLKVPVTSVKNWAGYVRQLKDTLAKPPLAVVTEISLVPDSKTQYQMKFKLLATIDDGDLIGELLAKRKPLEDVLMRPYEKREEQEAPQPRGRGSKVRGRTAKAPVPTRAKRR